MKILYLIIMQAGDASGTGLFDTANRKFDEERMRTIDQSLPEFFPELIGPNEVRPQHHATHNLCSS